MLEMVEVKVLWFKVSHLIPKKNLKVFFLSFERFLSKHV